MCDCVTLGVCLCCGGVRLRATYLRCVVACYGGVCLCVIGGVLLVQMHSTIHIMVPVEGWWIMHTKNSTMYHTPTISCVCLVESLW